MPGIDFRALRERITMEEVLALLNFQPVRRVGSRLRGPCPFQCSDSPRDFVADLARRRYRCFGCRRSGNQLELWPAVQGLPFHNGVRHLCDKLNITLPLIHRW